MPTRTMKSMVAAMTAGLGLVGSTFAADPGIVRISDEVPAGAPPAPAVIEAAPASPIESHPHTYSGNSHHDHGAQHHGHVEYVQHGDGVYAGRRGWPRHQPIHRDPVVYTHWYPQPVYGSSSAVPYSNAPMVAMPTDTTQLGFYYQQVPRWQPNPRPFPRPWFAQPGYVQGGGYVEGGGYIVEGSAYPVESSPSESHGGESYGGESYGGESHGGETIVPEAEPTPLGPGPDSLSPDIPPAPGDTTAPPIPSDLPTGPAAFRLIPRR